MNSTFFSEDQLDALQEVFNIAIGQAGASLASYFDAFVKLSVPKIDVIQSNQLIGYLYSLIGEHSEITVVRQSFYKTLRGESLTIYSNTNANDIQHLLDDVKTSADSHEEETLLDISNILVGACLKGIAKQFNKDLSFSPPAVLCLKTPIDRAFTAYQFAWEYALLIKITFRLEDRTSTWYLLFFVPSESIDIIKDEIDRFLGE